MTIMPTTVCKQLFASLLYKKKGEKIEMNPVTKVNPVSAPESTSVTGGAAAAGDSVKPATTTAPVFGAVPGMPGLFKSNFDYQLVRAMGAGAYGDGGGSW
jgi:hypothetical protein